MDYSKVIKITKYITEAFQWVTKIIESCKSSKNKNNI